MRYRPSHNTGALLRAARGMGDDEDFNPYAPAEWGSGYSDYWDQAAGIYWDEWGNAWDAAGSGVFDDPAFWAPVLFNENSTTLGPWWDDATGDIDLNELSLSPDYLDYSTGQPVTLPAITYNAGYILSVPSTTLASDPNAPAVLRNASTWDKIKATLAKVAKNVSMTAGGGSGAAAGARPSAVAPNASGQCPAGYAKNAAGQCQLVSQKPTSDSLSSLLSNPVLLILGIIAVAVIAKK